MKRILLILALLSFALSAQTRYYWPSPVNSSNGRPLNNAAVYLFDTEADTLFRQLTFATGSDGRYYSTSAIPTGTYTLKYLSGGSYYSIAGHVNVRYDASALDFSVISKGVISVEDTTVLKLRSANGDTARVVHLKQLSSSNTNGGGMFVYSDSAYPEGSIAFESSTQGKQWVDADALKGVIYASKIGSFDKLIDDLKSSVFAEKPTIYLNDTLTITTADTVMANILPLGGLITGSVNIHLDTVSILDNNKQVFSRTTPVSGVINNDKIYVDWFTPADLAASDSTAIANCAKIASKSATNQIKSIVFNAGREYRTHEIDFVTITGLSNVKIVIEGSNTAGARINYDGAGGSGSYMFKWGGLSYGGLNNLALNGYSSTFSGDTCEVLGWTNTQFDMGGEVKNFGFIRADYGWKHTGIFVNMYFDKGRWDIMNEYPILIDLDGVSGMERRPLKVSRFTYDNNNNSGGSKGFIKIVNPNGVELVLQDARIEFNGATDDSVAIVELEQNTSGVFKGTFQNITGYMSSSSNYDYFLSTDATGFSRFDLTFIACNMDQIRALLQLNRGSGYVEYFSSSDIESGIATFGGNLQNRAHLNIGGRKFFSSDRSVVGSQQFSVKYGDISYLTGGYTLPGQNATQMVAYPFVGTANANTSAVTTGSGVVGEDTLTVAALSDIYIGSNIRIAGANFNSADLYTRVSNIVGLDLILTDTLRTAASDANVYHVPPQWRDVNYRTSAAPTTGNWLLGEIVYNSAPSSGGSVGWVCINQGEAHTASTGTIANTSTSVTSVTNISTWAIGDVIEGYGIPANTLITNISGTTITLSAAATADSSGNALYDAQFKTWGAID